MIYWLFALISLISEIMWILFNWISISFIHKLSSAMMCLYNGSNLSVSKKLYTFLYFFRGMITKKGVGKQAINKWTEINTMKKYKRSARTFLFLILKFKQCFVFILFFFILQIGQVIYRRRVRYSMVLFTLSLNKVYYIYSHSVSWEREERLKKTHTHIERERRKRLREFVFVSSKNRSF